MADILFGSSVQTVRATTGRVGHILRAHTMQVPKGAERRHCDGLSRRSFLHIGGLAFGGLTLADILCAGARVRAGESHKSIIMVYLSGGLAHQDSFDLKPAAPREVRGEFNPINTTVPGIQICELLPELARMAHKYALVRSIVGLRDEHSSFQTMT